MRQSWRLGAGVLTGALLVAGCGGGSGGSSSGSGGGTSAAASQSGPCKDIASKYSALKGKTLTVGTSVGPGNYDTVNPDNPSEIIGVEPSLLTQVAKCVGFKYSLQKLDFQGLIPAVTSGRLDVVAAGMYATSERAKQINFVKYMKAATGAVVAKGKSIPSLDAVCGATVAEVTGTVENAILAKASDKCTAAGKPGIKTLTFAGNDQAVTAVRQGRADIFLTDAGVAAYLVKQTPDKLQRGFSVVSDFVFGFGVSKKNDMLLNAIHDALEQMYKDGSLQSTITRWGFTREQVVEPQIVT